MVPFVHLLDRDRYLPGLWDLRRDPAARAAWRKRLTDHMHDVVRHVEPEGAVRARAVSNARDRWLAFLDTIDDPAVFASHATVHHLVAVRDAILREALGDPYGDLKRISNETALSRYPDAIASIDALGDPAARLSASIDGALAGNVFDVAARVVTDAWRAGGDALTRLADSVRARAPAIDHRARVAEAIERADEGQRALLLVDNAGMDFVLGLVPLARELLARGFEVVLGANERPSLNDVTAREAVHLLREIGGRDPLLEGATRAGRLTVVSTGGATPGLDLGSVSRELNEAARSARLLVVIGQGRAIETGWTARLGCATLRVATIKSPLVAERIGLSALDAIVSYREPGEPAPDGHDPCNPEAAGT